MKTCNQCNIHKKNEDYYKYNYGKYHTKCKTCTKKNARESYRKNKETPATYSFEKYCTKCDTVKNNEEFHKSSYDKTRLQSYCKKCKSKLGKEYNKTQKAKTHKVEVKVNPRYSVIYGNPHFYEMKKHFEKKYSNENLVEAMNTLNKPTNWEKFISIFK